MPKLVFSTGSDEFFLVDDSYYYFKSLKGPSYLSMLPNAEHSCDGKETKLLSITEAFYVSCMKVRKFKDLIISCIHCVFIWIYLHHSFPEILLVNFEALNTAVFQILFKSFHTRLHIHLHYQKFNFHYDSVTSKSSFFAASSNFIGKI